MKTTQDNNLTNCIGVVYAWNYNELSGPMERSVAYTKTRQNNYVKNLRGAVYTEKKNELSWSIEPGVVYDDEN